MAFDLGGLVIFRCIGESMIKGQGLGSRLEVEAVVVTVAAGLRGCGCGAAGLWLRGCVFGGGGSESGTLKQVKGLLM